MKKTIYTVIILFFIINHSFGQYSKYKEHYENGKKYGFGEGFNYLYKSIIEATQNKIIINQIDLKKFIAQIIYRRNNKLDYSIPLINTFNNYKILGRDEYPENYFETWKDSIIIKYNFSQLFNIVEYQNSFVLPDSNNILVEMKGVIDGGEHFPYILALFRIEDSELHMIGLLDQIYHGSAGYVNIVEITQISEDSYILIGTTRGGDATYYWGSLWISYWKYPFDLELLYNKKFGYDLEKSRKQISHKFVKEDLQVKIILEEQKVIQYYPLNLGDFEIVETDTVNISEKLIDLRKE